MRIHEYQAKDLLKSIGIHAPDGIVFNRLEDAAACILRLGLPVALKCQVLSGRRGKQGAVRIVHSPRDADAFALEWLGRRFGEETVDSILAEKAVDVRMECYLSMQVDSCRPGPVVLASARGGVDVETHARMIRGPRQIAFGPWEGLTRVAAEQSARAMGIPGSLLEEGIGWLRRMSEWFLDNDCRLLEINPLAVTTDGRLAALDAKIEFDGNAMFRHPEWRALQPPDPPACGPAGQEPGVSGMVPLEGEIGILVNGAGLAMATMDCIRMAGGRPANFLDVGGGATEDGIAAAVERMSGESRLQVLLVHVFGGIVRCDTVAAGILRAAERGARRLPTVVRFTGTRTDAGTELLKRSGRAFVFAKSFAEAVQKAVSLVR
jgi:succinyl-CoA synthetase beta subunit